MGAGLANLHVRFVVTVSKMLAAEVPSTRLTFKADSRRSRHLSWDRIRSGFLHKPGHRRKDESKQVGYVSYGIVSCGVSGCSARVCTNRRQAQGTPKARAGALCSGA